MPCSSEDTKPNAVVLRHQSSHSPGVGISVPSDKLVDLWVHGLTFLSRTGTLMEVLGCRSVSVLALLSGSGRHDSPIDRD